MTEKAKAWWSSDGKWFCILANDGVNQATVSLTPEEATNLSAALSAPRVEPVADDTRKAVARFLCRLVGQWHAAGQCDHDCRQCIDIPESDWFRRADELLRLAASQPDTRWQPIETAPKEIVTNHDNVEYGRYILAYPVNGGVARVRWWQSKNDDTGHYRSFLTDGGAACRPTHWMPLPAPPDAGDRG